MTKSIFRKGSLLFLAIVFTVGLTFATVEIPQLLDGFLQQAVPTPGGDSHADEVAWLKTELFMAHYHVRAIGYSAFFLLLALIAAGFTTKRTGLAALGALGMMLAVFAQFASVMFFLAGLGMLNAIWLPVLDISYELQHWGLVIDAPNDALRWLQGLVGVESPWPTIVFFIGTGVLFFLLGTYAWLTARARGDGVAKSWVYRVSRHPQYLGWILWTYGAYLLIGMARYPKRSWGIGASLPWLISTLVIIAVALVEELNMRARHGKEYDAYRVSAPFLLPLPKWLANTLGAPFRLIFGKDRPERIREIVTVVGLYGMVLIGLSAFFYAGGLESAVARLSATERRVQRIEELVAEAAIASDVHAYRQRLLNEVASFGELAVEPLAALLEGPDATLRAMTAGVLGSMGSERSAQALEDALDDPDENVIHQATLALAAVGSQRARPALEARLRNQEGDIRPDVFTALASLGVEEILPLAPTLLAEEGWWTRCDALSAIGALGSEAGVPMAVDALNDEEPRVRRDAVIALLRIGSPAARTALERAVADSDYEVRVYAIEALDRLPPGFKVR